MPRLKFPFFYLSLSFFLVAVNLSLSLGGNLCGSLCHPVNFVRGSGGRQNVHHFYVDIVN